MVIVDVTVQVTGNRRAVIAENRASALSVELVELCSLWDVSFFQCFTCGTGVIVLSSGRRIPVFPLDTSRSLAALLFIVQSVFHACMWYAYRKCLL